MLLLLHKVVNIGRTSCFLPRGLDAVGDPGQRPVLFVVRAGSPENSCVGALQLGDGGTVSLVRMGPGPHAERGN